NRYYEGVKGWTKSLQLKGIADSYKFQPVTSKVRQVDFHGGDTTPAGHAPLTRRALPPGGRRPPPPRPGPTGRPGAPYAAARGATAAISGRATRSTLLRRTTSGPRQ